MSTGYNPNRDKSGQFATGPVTIPTPNDVPVVSCKTDDPAVKVWQETMAAYNKVITEASPAPVVSETRRAFRRTNYSGYLLENRDEALAALAEQGVEPQYERVIFEHVTYQYPDKNPAPAVDSIVAYGHLAKDGVQAVAVMVNGKHKREDGSYYHITVSIDKDHKPVDSNMLLVLNSAQIRPLPYPVPLNVTSF